MAEPASDRTAPKRPQGAKAYRALAGVASAGVLLFAHVITAVRAKWDGVAPIDEQRIFAWAGSAMTVGSTSSLSCFFPSGGPTLAVTRRSSPGTLAQIEHVAERI